MPFPYEPIEPVSKRVVRVISIEGNPAWVNRVLARSLLKDGEGKTYFTKEGTIKLLQELVLEDGEVLTGSLGKAPF